MGSPFNTIGKKANVFAANIIPASFRAACGLNPLVNLASSLILVAAQERIRNSPDDSHLQRLHEKLIEDIRKFNKLSRREGINIHSVIACRYVLCTVLDEAVLSNQLENENIWS